MYNLYNILAQITCHDLQERVSLMARMEYGIELWNGKWKGTVLKHTQLQLSSVTGAAQSMLNYLLYL